jgi:hypothetical protein
MSEGQTIGVTIESDNIDIAGATEIKFPDTQSRSMTSFSFTIFDTKPDTVIVENVKIEISTSGPNTDSKIALFGTGR